jgi:cytochrome b
LINCLGAILLTEIWIALLFIKVTGSFASISKQGIFLIQQTVPLYLNKNSCKLLGENTPKYKFRVM